MTNKLTLKKARLLADLTREQVAKKLKKNVNTIVSIENNVHVPRADLFMNLCKLYGVKCEDIKI